MFFPSFIPKSCHSDNKRTFKTKAAGSLHFNQMPPGRRLCFSLTQAPLPAANDSRPPHGHERAKIFGSWGTSTLWSHGQVYYQDAAEYFFIVFNSGLFTLPSNGLSNYIYYWFSLLFSSEQSPPPSPHFPPGCLPKFQATNQPEMTEAQEPGAGGQVPCPPPCVIGWTVALPLSHLPHPYEGTAFNVPTACQFYTLSTTLN